MASPSGAMWVRTSARPARSIRRRAAAIGAASDTPSPLAAPGSFSPLGSFSPPSAAGGLGVVDVIVI
jgi:hypothetical protein